MRHRLVDIPFVDPVDDSSGSDDHLGTSALAQLAGLSAAQEARFVELLEFAELCRSAIQPPVFHLL